jgi:hypothetical protein
MHRAFAVLECSCPDCLADLRGDGPLIERVSCVKALAVSWREHFRRLLSAD